MSNYDHKSDKSKKENTACESKTIVYVKEGDLCPNCGFARLKKEPGCIIRCPICGYGNGAGCT